MSRLSSGPADFDATKANSPLSVAPAQTAVLLMDYQNFIIGVIDKDKSPVPVASKLRDWALERKIPVYHCLIRTEGAKSSPPDHTRLSDRWSMFTAAMKDNPTLAEEGPELRPKDSQQEKVFLRMPGHISALLSDGLTEELKEKGIRSLILAGISTSGCVMSTVRGAGDQGFILTVVEDACVDPVPELHDGLMKHAFPTTAHIAKLEDIQSAWSSAGK